MGSQTPVSEEKSTLAPRKYLGQHSMIRPTLVILGGYSIFLITTFSSAVYFVSSSFKQINQSVRDLEKVYQNIEIIQDTFLYQAKDRKNLFLRSNDLNDIEEYSQEIENQTEVLKSQGEGFLSDPNPLAKPYKAEVKIFLTEHHQLMEIYRQGLAIARETQSLSAGDAYVRGKGHVVGEILVKLLDTVQSDCIALINAKNQQIKTYVFLITSGLFMLVLLSSLGLSWFITRPMRRIVRFTRFLEGKIPPNSPEEGFLSVQTLSNSGLREPPHQYRKLAQPLDSSDYPSEWKKPDEIGYMVNTYSKLAQRLGRFNQQLQARDSLLYCVNAATQVLVATEDLDTALNTMLRILGQGTGQCRAYILQIFRDEPTAELCFDLSYEWDALQIPSKRETGGRFPVPIKAFPDYLTAPLKVGQVTQFLARDLDGIAPQDRPPGQALSLVGVPITVDGEWWGLLGLDDCYTEWQWSDAEIAVLETAATALGSAVERDRHRQAREVAERQALIERERAERADALEAANQILSTRDRWLQTTATAAKQLLSNPNVAKGVDLALQTLGENLDCDRLGVMRHIPAEDGLGQFQLLHEWAAPAAIRQMNEDELVFWPASDFQAWTLQLMAGQSVGGQVADFDEAFRQKFECLETLCSYAVPLFIGSEFWGLMFMDYCQMSRELSPPELAVFHTAATCIGGAIEQDTVWQNKALQERAELLGSVAEVANLLLKSPDYTTVLPQVVQLLGEVVPGDRCGIAQVVSEPESDQTGIEIRSVWEWRSPLTLSIVGLVEQQPPFFTWEALPYIAAAMGEGKSASSLVVDLPACDRGILESQNILAILCVPITVEGQLWGLIHFDNCRQSRVYDEAEIAILQVAAESITAAITRQTQELALRQAERTILAEKEQAALQRTRLAHEIHDTLAQTFTGISLQLETARSLTDPETLSGMSRLSAHPAGQEVTNSHQPYLAQAHNAILQARNLARQGLAEARRSVRAFRINTNSPQGDGLAQSNVLGQSASASIPNADSTPPNDLTAVADDRLNVPLPDSRASLSDNICQALARVDPETGLTTQFYLEGDPCPLPDDLQLNLLSIAQEAITNTQRHAKASQLDITLSYETTTSLKQIRLRIVDDGQGFETTHLLDQAGLGLIGIRERAARFYGSFELQSSLTIGTTLDIVIPL